MKQGYVFGIVGALALGAFVALPAVNGEEPTSKPTKAEVGKAAPDFTLKGLDGKPVKLSDHKGKIVVLEWYNPQCPYVVRHHKKLKTMTTMAKKYKDKGVVWVAINSGAPGKQGTGLELNQKMAKGYGIEYPVLFDENGEVGRRYGARTTPHMYVIDKEGVLRYAGGIDNDRRGRLPAAEKKNYVSMAVEDLLAGREVAVKSSKPYGCSVKYGAVN